MRWSTGALDVLEGVLLEREQACPDCGTREDEWGVRRPEPDGTTRLYLHEHRPYVARTRECQGCKATEQRMAEYKGQVPPGVKVRLVPPG